MESYVLMWMGCTALLGSYGQETTARLLWRDVQRLQEASTALQESEERYKFLVESAPEQIWTLSPDGTLDFANRAATEYFGVSVETAVKVGWAAGVHREDLAHVLPIFERSIKTGP